MSGMENAYPLSGRHSPTHLQSLHLMKIDSFEVLVVGLIILGNISLLVLTMIFE